ncbi:MAG TPA: hypothetical protein VMB21_07945 [Candidatus Limnocylindria bacterium]|nr:hypothetical protein [Candidatus Limnocylindria bacterium]
MARSVVTYQAGLPHGSKHINAILSRLHILDREEPITHPVFEEYLRLAREFPTGTERLHWSRAALREVDIQLEAVNRQFRDRLFDACYEIIDQCPPPGESP